MNRTGRAAEGLKEAQAAYTLNPLALDNVIGLAMRLYTSGRHDEALATMARATELNPGYFETWVHLGEMYATAGRAQDAIAAAERGVELSRRSPHAIHMLAAIHARVGDRAEAKAILDSLEKGRSHRNAYEVATTNLVLGDTDSALRWFQAACDERTPQMAFFRFVERNRQFDPLRSDPRFEELLRCTGAQPTH